MIPSEPKVDKPRPQAAMLLALAIIVLLGIEAFRLNGLHQHNSDIALSNVRRANQNAIEQRKITDLKAGAERIKGLYLRLQDSVVVASAKNAQELPSLSKSATKENSSQSAPEPIEDFRKAGFEILPAPEKKAESSKAFDLGSNQLEFHRIVPLLAQAENSNPFLFIDHLAIARPKATEAFSHKPTALQSRLTVRLLNLPQ
jgi:Type II secretion system (T2SS), protein M subtype b